MDETKSGGKLTSWDQVDFGQFSFVTEIRDGDVPVMTLTIFRLDPDGSMTIPMEHKDLVRIATMLLTAAADINPDNRRGNG